MKYSLYKSKEKPLFFIRYNPGCFVYDFASTVPKACDKIGIDRRFTVTTAELSTIAVEIASFNSLPQLQVLYPEYFI